MRIQKRICIDARMIGPKGHGLALYVEELAHALCEHFTDYSQLSFLVSPKLPADSIIQKLPKIICQAPFLSPRELLDVPRLLRQHKIELYISPSFSTLATYPCPYVMGIHDLNHLHFGSISKKIYYKLLLKPAALKAKAIFTVSESSRKEIASWLGVSTERILVSPNAIQIPEALPTDSVLQRYSLSAGKFFVGVGTSKPHKNLGVLLSAYEKYGALSSDPWPLLITLPNVSGKGVVSLGNIPYPDLMALFRSCGGFLCPSLYEGFSRAPVEALLAGAPTVASDILVHREVLGGVPEVHFAPPQNSSAWAEAMQLLEKKKISPPSGESRQKLTALYSRRAQLRPILSLFTEL